MEQNNFKNNKIIILFSLIFGFITAIIDSIILFIKQLFGKQTNLLKENKFLDSLNFIFNIGPKSFWQNPTGLKIGRSIATLIYYIFDKDDSFKEKKN
ncbi:hypothetical protein KAZ01_00195 [Candidatus Gracilibacteria bacterium]|nr:hypothetical protein [Candidatus Gracilibacteria bacterium]